MMINKRRVAQFFHAALESYEQNSVAQQKIGQHLLQILLAFLLSAFTILSVNITKAQESSFVKIKARQIINFPIKNLPLKFN